MYHQLNAYSPKQLSFACHGTLFSKKQPLTFELGVLKRKIYDLENDDLKNRKRSWTEGKVYYGLIMKINLWRIYIYKASGGDLWADEMEIPLTVIHDRQASLHGVIRFFFQITIKHFLGFSAVITIFFNPLQWTEIWRRKIYLVKVVKFWSISASKTLFKMEKKRL